MDDEKEVLKHWPQVAYLHQPALNQGVYVDLINIFFLLYYLSREQLSKTECF